MKYLVSFVILLVSSFSFAGSAFTINYTPDISKDTDVTLGHDSDYMLNFSLYGLNFDPTEARYLTQGFFLQYGLSSHAHQKRLYNFVEQTMFNAGMSMPLNKEFFVSGGLGVVNNNVQLLDGSEVEKERYFNIHVDANYVLDNFFIFGVSYDTALKQAGLNVGFNF